MLLVFAWSLLDDDMFTERYGDDDGAANGVILVSLEKNIAHNMFRVSNPTYTRVALDPSRASLH